MAENDLTFDLTCPHCRTRVRPLRMSNNCEDARRSRIGIICHCPREKCGLFYVELRKNTGTVEAIFPLPDFDESSLHEAVPEAIRRDIAEANRALYAGAFKAVVVMSRRAMQNIALDKGASGDTLEKQIDDLGKKGFITENLRHAAHELRHFGNFGAHPRDDGLDNISKEDADAVMDIVEGFVMDIYVRPAETAKLTAKRTENRE